MKQRRLTIYVDMDDTLCDFSNAVDYLRVTNPGIQYPQSQYGFFTNLKPIDGAIESIKKLSKYHDVWIATRPSYLNPLCYTEKRIWVEEKLGIDWTNKLIIIPNKSLLIGDIIIDDIPQSEFLGKQILFGQGINKTWKHVLKNILPD